jgi:hypothetical protein
MIPWQELHTYSSGVQHFSQAHLPQRTHWRSSWSGKRALQRSQAYLGEKVELSLLGGVPCSLTSTISFFKSWNRLSLSSGFVVFFLKGQFFLIAIVMVSFLPLMPQNTFFFRRPLLIHTLTDPEICDKAGTPFLYEGMYLRHKR